MNMKFNERKVNRPNFRPANFLDNGLPERMNIDIENWRSDCKIYRNRKGEQHHE